AAVSRRLLEPSQAALDDASKLTIDWIDKAFELRANADRTRKAPPPREEGTEAPRALQTGRPLPAPPYLPDPDPRGGVGAIEKAQARDLVRAELMAALASASEKPSSERWLEVLHALRPVRDPHGGDDEGDDDLLRAAGFTVAAEAYRLDPTQIEA